MRLLYITVRMPFGTGEEFLIPEVRELLRLGHEVLIVPRSPPGAVFNRDAATFVGLCERAPLLSFRIVVNAVREAIRNPGAFIRIAMVLAASRSSATLLKNILVVPKGLWVGHLAKTWGAGHIHAHWATTTATMAMIASEVSDIPWSFTAHRGDIAANNLLTVKVERAAFVRFISCSGLKMAQSIAGRAVVNKGVVIHMGVDVPEEPCIDEVSSVSRRLYCPASLFPVKGHQYLLHAMALLKERHVDCCLHILGEGPLRRTLERMTKHLGVDDVVCFRGALPHNEVVMALRNHDVSAVVLPSVDLGENFHEGIPVCLMEAMAHAVPVISTCSGGIPELLSDRGGIMVPPRDPVALANAIQELLSKPDLWRESGRGGLERIKRQFSVKITTMQLIAKIEGVIRIGA